MYQKLEELGNGAAHASASNSLDGGKLRMEELVLVLEEGLLLLLGEALVGLGRHHQDRKALPVLELKDVAAKVVHLVPGDIHNLVTGVLQPLHHSLSLLGVFDALGANDRHGGTDAHDNIRVVHRPPLVVSGVEGNNLIAHDSAPLLGQGDIRALREDNVRNPVDPVKNEAARALKEGRLRRLLLSRQVNEVSVPLKAGVGGGDSGWRFSELRVKRRRIESKPLHALQELGPPLLPPVGDFHGVKNNGALSAFKVSVCRKPVVGEAGVRGVVVRLVSEQVHLDASDIGQDAVEVGELLQHLPLEEQVLLVRLRHGSRGGGCQCR